jgi:hypothetical protein
MRGIIITIFLVFGSSIFGQNLQRQMVSAQGNSIALTNGMYISQSIGQQSITGTSLKNNFTLSQGYQQSLWNSYIKINDISLISTKTYPNPFFDTINFQFSNPISSPVKITLFDITGKIVLQQTRLTNITLITISNIQLPSGTYIVHLSADKLNYYTKIIQSK